MKNQKNPKTSSLPTSKSVVHMKPSAIAKAKRHRKVEEDNFSAELSQGASFFEEERDEDRDEINEKSFIENDDFNSLRTNLHQRVV